MWSKVLPHVKNPYIINQNHIFSKNYCEVISGSIDFNKFHSCNNAVEIPKTTVQRRPIPPTYPNSCWQIDLMKMQPVRGFGYICNIVDCYSRFAFGGPLKGKHAKDVAGLLLKFIYLLGSLHILQSENGKEFDLSQVVEDFKTRQIHGRSYHPHSQGCVERFNRTLTEYFRRELYVACKGLALKTARILLQ
jgi:transposase InsO family protein